MKTFKRKMLGIYRKKVMKIPRWCKRIVITQRIKPIYIKITLGEGIETTGYKDKSC